VHRMATLAVLALMIAGISLGVGWAAPQPLPTPMMHRLQLTPAMRVNQFESAMNANKVTQKDQRAAIAKFKQLPDELQDQIITTLQPDYAKLVRADDLLMTRVDARWLRDHLELAFMISSIWPSQGTPDGWGYAYGMSFNDDCKIFFDGVEVETYYLSWSFEFFPNSLAFKIPAAASRGVEHEVYARNMTNSNQTAIKMYEIVAPRSYRGIWGWKFHNFSDNTIPWHLYSNYFGESAVEYSNGTHRPAAQAWYDSAYKGAGGGGNCYGMSVSSLRFRNSNFSHMNWGTWLNDPANHHQWLWDYEWQTETKETVQQMQGSWYTQEQLDAYVAADSAQDARGCYNRVASLVTQPQNRPVLVYWGNGWGHAVVPYGVRVNGDAREMLVYDNNNPYRENETGNVDPSIATVNWGANTFSCGGGTTGICVSYNECTPANPHLPGSEYGGPGAETSVIVASSDTKINQITDEAGRTFFNPDGTRNTNPNTSIPNSTVLYPLVQGPVIRGPVLRGPVLRGPVLQRPEIAPRVPTDAPTVFVFANSSGKDLQIALSGPAEKQCSLFQRGVVFEARANGAGDLKLNDLLSDTFTVEVLNPQALQVTRLQFIRSTRPGDKMFNLDNLRGLDAQTLRLLPNKPGTRLDVEGGPALQFDLQIQGPVGQGANVRNFTNLALQAGAALRLQPTDWKSLGQSQLRLQLRNLGTNQVIQTQTLDPQ